MITTNETTSKFTEFSCAGGLVKITLKGTGLLGLVTRPVIGGTSATGEGHIRATAEGQEFTETVEGEKFGLESNTNGGAFEPAYINSGTETATLNEGAEATTTTETP